MESLAFVRPFAFWLALPLLAVVAWLLRRGGGARRQVAPVWLFDEQRQASPGRRRLDWRNPLAAGVLLSGALWILAWATPVARRGPELSALVLLDAGVPAGLVSRSIATVATGPRFAADARWLEQLVARWRGRGNALQFYVAGCAPAGPYDDLAQACAAPPAPGGPTLQELLSSLNPKPAQRVVVVGWRSGPAAVGNWQSRALADPLRPRGRLVLASLDGEAQLAVAAVGLDGTPLAGGHVLAATAVDTMRLTLDAQGRAEADLSDWSLAPDAAAGAPAEAAGWRLHLRLEGDDADAELAVIAPPRRLLWLACEDREWDLAIRAWSGFEVRRVERSRLPTTEAEWDAWRQRGGPSAAGELFVAVGAPPPALPESVPWLWIAPEPARYAQLSFGRRPRQADPAREAAASAVGGRDHDDALWCGLDLSGSPPAAELLAMDNAWFSAAGERVVLGRRAAVLNLRRPLSATSGSEPALTALRLAQRLLPAPASLAGPGLPSPPWRWPATTEREVSGAPAGATRVDARWARGLLVGAVAISLLVVGRAPVRRWGRAVAGASLLVIAGFALRSSPRPLLLVLDASQSCRSQVSARAARALTAMGTRGAPAVPEWIAALDGAGGRWLATPASPASPPRDEAGLTAWLDARLQALPRSSHTRLAPAMRGLAAAAGLRSAHTLLVSDGGFDDTPASLGQALPRGPLTVIEAPAGRPADAAIVSLALEERGGRMHAHVVADDGGRASWLELEVDGQLVGRHALIPGASASASDSAQGAGAPLHRVRLPLPHGSSGRGRVLVHVIGEAAAQPDAQPENDAMEVVDDQSPPRVRWTAANGSERWLPESAVSAASLARPAAALDLADVWVLDAVAESLVASLEDELLAALDRGTGLVLLAGPGSWLATGRGGQRALEERLPVRLRVPDERDPSPAPWMLLIDASGSMATVEGGTSHFERALVALSAALAAARPEESVGVLAFAERVLAAIPPQPGLTRERLQPALHGVRPSGGTRLLPALEQAGQMLRAASSSAARAHRPRLVVLSDGLTGSEDPLRWREAARECQVIVLEIGDQGSPALRELCVATGGHHRLLRSLDDLTQALTEEAVFPPRDRVVLQDEPVQVEDPAWGSLAPAKVAAHVALARAEGHTPWTLGRLRDPLLALRETGIARVAVLATSPGEPWAGTGGQWRPALAAVVAWAGRKDQPTAAWVGAEAPRLLVDARAARWAAGAPTADASLLLVGVAGDSTRLEAVAPGTYRPAGPPPRGDGYLIARDSGRTVARLARSDAAAELRARGIERERLVQLAASLPGGASASGEAFAAPPRAGVVGLAAVAWILAAAALALAIARRGPPRTPLGAWR